MADPSVAPPSPLPPVSGGTVRLPLELGTSSLSNLAYGAGAAGAGVVLSLATLAMVLGTVFGHGGFSIKALLIMGGISFGLVTFGLNCLKRAWQFRPSDMVLEPERLRIEGGEHDGFRTDWIELNPTQSRVDTHHTPRDVADMTWQLILVDGATPRVVAETDDKSERDSFKAVVATLQARMGDAPEDAPPPTPLEVLRCPRCGAVATPSDAATVACDQCGAAIAIPDALRARVKAAHDLAETDRHNETLLDKLLHQPGASATQSWMKWGAAFILLAWPVALGEVAYQGIVGNLSAAGALLMLALPGAVIAGVYLSIRPIITDRRALRLVSLDFCSRPPTTEGGPEGCRQCGAPIPPSEAVLVRCVYCGAENITGLDLRGRATDAAQRASSLKAAFGDWKRERRRALSKALWLGAPLLVASGLGFYLLIRPSHPLVPAAGVGAPTRLTSSTYDERRPVPDRAGNELITQTSREGILKVIPLDGHAPRKLDVGEDARFPTWAPDGKHVVYVSCPSDEHACALRISPTETPRPATLYTGGKLESPSFGPAGRIVFVENGEISLARLRDHRLADVVRVARGSDPVFSPHGTRLAYVSGKRLVTRTVDATGLGPEKVLSKDSGGGSFSPDGRRFVQRRSGEGCVLEVLAPGAAPRPLMSSTGSCDPPSWIGRGIVTAAEPYGNFDVVLLRPPG